MLQTVVFLSGAVLMSLEMVGSRLLAPTFGSSIYIWGSLIVVVMTALTLGYYFGGRIADKFPNYRVMGLVLAWRIIGMPPLWRKRAKALYASGAIKENVPEYVKTMADGAWIRKNLARQGDIAYGRLGPRGYVEESVVIVKRKT